MKKYRIVNKKRFIMAIILLICILVTIFSMINNLFHNIDYEVVNYKEYTIKTGDTLWDIANQINPGMDIREVVNDILHINNFDNTPLLYEGDVIKLPIYQNK